ncbi:hypothetical protein NA63_2610 [Flavobacteriaceae bacterium MAR_2010_105]|nr:hypothetical protein NA63_2610 [Flavobacteriaceae bacterium MAR_2010_105]
MSCFFYAKTYKKLIFYVFYRIFMHFVEYFYILAPTKLIKLT